MPLDSLRFRGLVLLPPFTALTAEVGPMLQRSLGYDSSRTFHSLQGSVSKNGQSLPWKCGTLWYIISLACRTRVRMTPWHYSRLLQAKKIIQGPLAAPSFLSGVVR